MLPSCAAPRHSVTWNAPADAEHARSVETSPVVQAAYRQENPDDTVSEPATVPHEIVPVPEPIVGGDADSGPLSLGDLEQMAMENNPSIEEAGAKVGAARGRWVQAGLPPNPRLGYSGQQLGSGGQAEQHGVYVEQEFIRGGKLGLGRAVASQEIVHAEQQFEVQRRRVLTDVRMGYYAVLCAQRRLELTEELVRIGNQATKAAQDLFEKKEASRRDLLQARIESQSAQTFLQQARNQHLAAWRMLAAVLGSPHMQPRSLVGRVDETATELAWENSLQRLLSESPEIAAAFVQVERARWAVDRARAEAVADVNVQGIIQSDNATGSTNGNLLVSIPIPVLNRNQGGIRQAESELVAAERAAQRMELAMQHRLAPVFERYLSSRNRVDNFRGGILRDAEESLKLTRQGYEAGELSFLNLLTAQRTYFQANLNYIEALCSMWAASAEIEGLLLTNSLEEGGGTVGPAYEPAAQRGLPSMAGRL
ncbi:MAG: TolC family protein [Planctomycetota bacterium]|nr:MAG: TolC family protein [Planctomycetota bacterium]REJ92102.1 MAG: TolC family protein [Planctomycetota bacterium]REK28638.1 MAG: TolC family protein [Planctomycetota bacterium]REK39252.1 MAG: TolC family protein [Planctomycetota bacterium]